jgi:hypothetical protein
VNIEELVESPEGQELAALCLDFGYRFAQSPRDLTRDQIHFLFTAYNHRMERVSASAGGEPGVTKFVFFNDEDDEG